MQIELLNNFEIRISQKKEREREKKITSTLTIYQRSRHVHLLMMMSRWMLMMMWRMDLQQVRSRLGEGGRRWFPRSSHAGTGRRVIVLAAELVARTRSGRAGAIHHPVSIIIVVANVAVVIIVVAVAIIAVIAIVREPRGGRARRRATTTTSTATDTSTANAVDLHHFAVDRSRRLGSTRRGRDAATDHHHQTISPPPPPHSATRLLPLLLFLHLRVDAPRLSSECSPVSHPTDFFTARRDRDPAGNRILRRLNRCNRNVNERSR